MSALAPVLEALTILIAEDSAADRLLLASIIRRQGHQVLTVSNGAEAIEVFARERPQLVLMDALMPVMDGFEAARQIKQLAGEALVPIIFLTSLRESEALAQCLDAGGDDFLPKPYNPLILAAKINAMDRLRRLQATVLQQRDLIARHHEHLMHEQRAAKAVFDKVAHSGCINAAPNIRYLQSPYALFNGDLLLAAYTPSGDMHVLLGDFTGHGLPAAIGAMPLAEVFYGMTAKGYGLTQTLREMNAKLKRILPVDMFCCATLLCLSAQRRAVEVWNGGMPEGYVHEVATGRRTPLMSRHLPLGVLSAEAFDDSTEVWPMALGDRVFLLSDGVLDTADANDQLFGAERLQQVFAANREPDRLFEDIEQALAAFRGQARDDVSMVEITLQAGQPLRAAEPMYADSGRSCPLDWSVSFEFRAQTLRTYNPLPYLLQLLLEIHGLRAQSGALYSVMAELYSNALEHGVLGLDSRLKRDAQGFAQYYRQRHERLAQLDSGYVRVHVQVVPTDKGGKLTLRLEDSGQGFDVEQELARPVDIDRLSGRGLSLVRQLSSAVGWSDGGRTVCVEFCWAALA
ncbi:MAG: fused response regulator/phosphatase [Pseudomonadales bacterium RIFCSPLOWO2_12_60_38]|uniref:fused response regulator/phosphatase n=1 Tax=Pseudomonas TaxID=286 RepID=UPI00025E841F|nr:MULTISPECIES: fused response regulator/phosphatase [Pseudomonas]AFJ58978.1 response regulator [Pseudomonas fluorescens A506]AOS74964.1 fused response regulator/phosphatase [Pseudomonas fluorescens]ETK42037.1 chemotaxis protein CheY [Pseudomonas fluorescens FH5]OHC34118.1 MAG: fused response regulator/phosphatase [Pseudomonadales bacterium RIFCSPLOWO2_12_60_38]OHC36557.1 MAG: fused response regulator/phosphatase [Pseudomonadales bacterium RIFCSPLOWO2_12_FULL_59_450]